MKRLVPFLFRKMELWEKCRGDPPPHHMPQSPTLTARQPEGKATGATTSSAAVNLMSDSKINLSPDFKKKYEQWQKMKNQDAQMTAGNGKQ